MNKKRFAIIIAVILFISFKSEIMLVFRNTDGEFDFSIFWSAFSGMATLVLGLIALWQTSLFRKNDSISNYKTKLTMKNDKRPEKYSYYTSNNEIYEIKRQITNLFIIRKKNSLWKSLTLNMRFTTRDGIIPDKYSIKSIQMTTEKHSYDILSDDLIYQPEAAIINERSEDDFFCCIEIIDEGLEKYITEELIVVLVIMFYCENIDFYIETKYYYSFDVKLINHSRHDRMAMYTDKILLERGAKYIRQKEND